MTDPIIDRLDQIKGRADKATEGPWLAEHSGEQGNCVIPHDAKSTRESVAVIRLLDQQADAEFIAHARTDVPRIEAALRAVLDLHKPTTMDFIVGDCAAEDCEHDDPDDCSTAPRKVCGGCLDQAECVTPYAMECASVAQSVIWPCDHVHAIAAALGVETEGEER